jgi:hypothetical protein
MVRREFLGLTAAAIAAAQQKKPANESVTATATQDTTPRVGVVLSSFTGAAEHDGTKLKGLADPRPNNASLTDAQFDALVRRAIELGDTRTGGLDTAISPDDWVVIKPDITSCYGLGPEIKDGGAHLRYVPGSVTDLRMVRTLIHWLLEHKCGARFTIAEGSPEWLPMERSKSPTDGWTTTWGGAFGGLSYKSLVADLGRKFPAVKFDLVDLNFDEPVELPVQGAPAASKNPSGAYYIPKTIQQCDKLISLSPLKTDRHTGVSLAMKNYIGIAPGSRYGFPKRGLDKLGDPNEVLVDLYSFHPADYAIVGGCFGVEGDPSGDDAASVHHNLVIAGMSAVAVDMVGAAVMGFEPSELKFLSLAEKKGFGGWDMVDLIWTRGNGVEEAARKFRRAAPAKT